VLLDASGGQGIDTPVEVAPAFSALKVGYAGGINPDNVAEKLTYLLEHVETGDFWIDMESGVRTNDWFDLDKVYTVLEICQSIIDKYKED
jgi:phosphoribosylanthranilate isomerase